MTQEIFFYTLLKALCFGWFISNFEPLQYYITKLTNKIKWNTNPLINYLKTAPSCFKCLSFWSAIILSINTQIPITYSFYIATGSAFIAYTLDKIFSQFKIYLN